MLLTRRRVRAARILAALVDLFQIALLPTLFPVAVSGVNNIIDIGAAVVLIAMTGFHWAYLPTFMIEMVPMAEVAPTWTAAVYIATRELGSTEVEDAAAARAPISLPSTGDQAPPSSSGS